MDSPESTEAVVEESAQRDLIQIDNASRPAAMINGTPLDEDDLLLLNLKQPMPGELTGAYQASQQRISIVPKTPPLIGLHSDGIAVFLDQFK